MTSLEEIDRFRKRWQVVRQAESLAGARGQDFALGGLGGRVADLAARVLLLPADPEGHVIEFDEEFWSWWETSRPGPVHETSVEWGTTCSATTHAAIRFSRSNHGWDPYLALHRCGTLEAGIGRGAAAERGETRVFRLVPLLGRIWSALEFYGDVVTRYEPEGPWQAVVGLRRTKGSFLSGLATGWADPLNGMFDPTPCADEHVLLTREIPQWPSDDGVRDLAMTLGGWIENAWGYKERRFLAREGPHAGEFDRNRHVG